MFGEITKNEDNTAHFAIGIANGRAAVVDRNFASIPADKQSVVSQADDHALLHHFIDRVFRRLPRLLVQNPKDISRGMPSRFGKSPTGDAFRDTIHEIDPALLVGHDHAIANTAESNAKKIFLRLQGA